MNNLAVQCQLTMDNDAFSLTVRSGSKKVNGMVNMSPFDRQKNLRAVHRQNFIALYRYEVWAVRLQALLQDP
nr:hypothetical protein CFP56_78141 [Quercus suber]